MENYFWLCKYVVKKINKYLIFYRNEDKNYNKIFKFYV